jgi:hypothetical protein
VIEVTPASRGTSEEPLMVKLVMVYERKTR